MKLRAQPVCPCCECEILPVRAGFGRLACSFCACEFRHNIWHWMVGLPLLGAAGYGAWFLLGKAFSASFALAWPFKLLFSVIAAFLVTWPIIGLIDPYKIIKRGEPPRIVPMPMTNASVKSAARSNRKAA